MKKGRHRRYEEARKFKRQSSSIEDIDLETDPFFGEHDDDDEVDDGDDPWADLAAKYNADDEDDDER